MVDSTDHFEVVHPYAMSISGPGKEDPEYVAMRAGVNVQEESVEGSTVFLKRYRSARLGGTWRFGVLVETREQLRVVSFAGESAARRTYGEFLVVLRSSVFTEPEPSVELGGQAAEQADGVAGAGG